MNRQNAESEAFQSAIGQFVTVMNEQGRSCNSFSAYFDPYVCYNNRILRDYEYERIFGQRLLKTAIQKVHAENLISRSDLQPNEIELRFLHNWCQKDKNWRWGSEKLEYESPYVRKFTQADPRVRNLLEQLAGHQDVKKNPAHAFNFFFNNREKVDKHKLEQGLTNANILTQYLNDCELMVEYFAIDRRNNHEFGLVEFSEGMIAIQAGTGLENVIGSKEQITGQVPLHEIMQCDKTVTDYNLNCTQASVKNTRQPQNFVSKMDDLDVNEILKGCFNTAHLVQNHFAKFADNNQLTETKFRQALTALDITWGNDRVQQIHFAIDDFVNNNARKGSVKPEDIDQYICWSSKFTMRQLHDEVLIRINESKSRFVNLANEFDKLTGSRSACSLSDFKSVLAAADVYLSAVDEKFVTRKYLVDLSNIDHKKFTNEVNNAQNLKEKKQMMKRLQDDDERIAINAHKVCFLKGRTFRVLLQGFLTHRKEVSKSEFRVFYSDQKGLGLTIYGACTDFQLHMMFDKIEGASFGNVKVESVEQQYDRLTHGKTEVTMSADLINEIRNHQYFSDGLEEIKRKSKNGSVQKKFFTQMLEDVSVNKLDVLFLSKVYQINDMEVDLNRFAKDCMVQQTSLVKLENELQFYNPPAEHQRARTALFDFLKKQNLVPLFAFILSQEKSSMNWITAEGVRVAVEKTMRSKSKTSTYKLEDARLLCEFCIKNGSNRLEVDYTHVLWFVLGSEQDTKQAMYDGKLQGSKREGELTQKRLQEVDDLLKRVCLELNKKHRSQANVIQALKSVSKDGGLNVPFQEFKAFIRDGVKQNQRLADDIENKDAQRGLTDQKEIDKLRTANWNLMATYLQRDVWACISVKKFEQVLYKKDFDPPLAQDFPERASRPAVQKDAGYTQQLDRQIDAMQPIKELSDFMKDQNFKTVIDLLGIQRVKMRDPMNRDEFIAKLKAQKFNPTSPEQLVKSCEAGQNLVDLQALEQKLDKFRAKKQPLNTQNAQAVKQKFGNIAPEIRQKMNRISDFLTKNDITIDQFHSQLDTDKDGFLQRDEFSQGVLRVIKESGLFTQQDLHQMFDAMDINQDGQISANEFALFITGGKVQRNKQLSQLDPDVRREVDKKVDELFQDLQVNGKIVAEDLVSFAKFTHDQIPIEQARSMIKQIDVNGDGKIDKPEFHKLVAQVLVDELFRSDLDLEDLRDKFRDADTDNSGFLSIDELYACLIRQGTNITRNECIELFKEFDTSGDRLVDIDEFCFIFMNASNMKLSNDGSKNTLLEILKTQKLNKFDFFKVFKSIPNEYAPSFYHQRFTEQKKNLPSSVFRVQVDQRTLQWKDFLHLDMKSLTKDQIKNPALKPKMQPIPNGQFSSVITLESADGLLAPPAEYKSNICKRVVRVGLWDQAKRDLQYNCCFVNAFESSASKWLFKPKLESQNLNPIILKTSEQDQLDPDSMHLIFELVLYIKDMSQKQNNYCKEFHCGWGKLPLKALGGKDGKHVIDLFGGSPYNQMQMSEENKAAKPAGGLFGGSSKTAKPTVTISVQQIAKLQEDLRFHTEMLPSTCLVNKKVVQMASAFRNYCADKILPQINVLKKPEADIVIKYFPMILDCPDALEAVSQVWYEDITTPMSRDNQKNIDYLVSTFADFIKKVFPVFSAVGFDYRQSTATMSYCCEGQKLLFRDELIKASLRQGDPKKKVKKAPEMLDTFKPFNIAELQYDTWDETESKFEQMFKFYGSSGLVENDARAANALPKAIAKQSGNTFAVPVPK